MKVYNTLLFIIVFCVVAGVFIVVRNVVWDQPETQIVFTPYASPYTPPVHTNPVLCISSPFPSLEYLIKEIGKERITFSCESTSLPLVTISSDVLGDVVLEKRKEDDAITQQLQYILNTQEGFFWFSLGDLGYITSHLVQQLASVDPEGARYYIDNAYRLEYDVETLMQETKSHAKEMTIRAHELWAPFIYEFRGYLHWEKDNSLDVDTVILEGQPITLDPFGKIGTYSGYIDFLRAHVAHLE